MAIILVLAGVTAVAGASEGVPASRTAIFEHDEGANFLGSRCRLPPAGITDFWTPTLSDVTGIESSLLQYLSTARPELASWLMSDDRKRLAGDWSWARRRVVGVLISDRRALLIEYQFEDPDETAQKEKAVKAKMGQRFRPDWWKNTLVRGGGFSVFRVLYEVKARRFTWYEENDSE